MIPANGPRPREVRGSLASGAAEPMAFRSAVNTPPNLVPPTPGTPGPSSNFIYRRPGADVARALHTVYLIFLVGGLMSSLLYPMFVKRAPHLRRRPLLV